MPDIGYAMFKGVPQPTQKITNQSAHVDGGNSPGVSGSMANRNASADARSVLWTSCAIVLAAIAILWFSGAFAFRGVTL